MRIEKVFGANRAQRRFSAGLGLLLTLAATVVGQPSITSFSPPSGSVGSSVTITGAGFSVTPSSNIVYFGGVMAGVDSVSGTTQLTVTVPAGATYDPITVTVGGLTAYSNRPFAVTFGAAPIDASAYAPKVDYTISPSTGPRGIALGDIDGDGKPDLVVAATGSSDIRIIRNTSSSGGLTSGSFVTPGVSYAAGTAPTGVALGDLDGDGDLDVAVTDSSSGAVYLWQNGSMPGTIASTNTGFIGAGSRPFGIAIHDIDGDGQPDIVVTKKSADSISVFLNITSGPSLSFANRIDYSTLTGSNPVDVAVGDIDGDQVPDIVTANSGSTSNKTSVIINQSFPDNILFLSRTDFQLGTAPTSLSLVDLDGDGKLDIVSANSAANTLSLLRNTSSSPGTASFAGKVDIGAGSNPYDVAVTDLDGDGKPDAVVANRSMDSVSVLRNTTMAGAFSASSLAPIVQFSVGTSPAGVALGDVDGDGKPEIVSANQSSNNVSILRNKAVRIVAEVGNDSSSATVMTYGETIQSAIQSNSDADYYKFTMSPGDTVSILGQTVNSNLYFGFEIIDGFGITYKSRYAIVNLGRSWHVFAPSLAAPKTFFLRASYLYSGNSFPNSRPDGNQPPVPPAGAAAPDSGVYQLSLQRFVSSAPEVYYYPNVYSLSYNRGRWSTQFYPNRLSTNVFLEYSVSSDMSGAATVEATGSPRSGINREYLDSPFTGLQPNTQYYYRVRATNSLGTAYSQINSFTTPAAPVGWVHQNSGLSYTLYGVSFGDDVTGVVAGEGGSWARTSDGGSTWAGFTNPSGGYALYSVWMVNSLLGYAVGSGESVIKTTDGGANWANQTTTGSGYSLRRVKFINSNAGVAVGYGGLIIRTANGGTLWTQERFSANDVYGVDYADFNTVVAVGYQGTILRSTNGGADWDSIPSGTSATLNAVDFVSSTVGYIVGDQGTYMKSTDGGLSWSILGNPSGSNYYLYDIAFKDANNGILVGAYGMVLRTADGGSTWTSQSVGTSAWLFGTSYRGRVLSAVGEYGLILNSLDPKSEVEPNDAAGTAMALVYRDEVNASIQPTGDVDFYQFTASGTDTVEVTVVNTDTAVVNGTLWLIGTNQTTLLDSSDNFIPGDTTRSRIVYVLPGAGNFYLKYQANSPSVTGNYRIGVRKINDLKPVIPFGGAASVLTTTSAILSAPVITNNLGTTVEFEYGPTVSYGTTVAADQSPLTGTQSLDQVSKTLSSLNPFAEYHFRVKAMSSAGTTYGPDVAFLTSLGTLRTEAESNNTTSEANTIFIGDTVDADISTNTDVDYYRFQAAAGDSLEIFAGPRGTSTLISRVELWDSTNTSQLVYNNFMPSPGTLHNVVIIAQSGIYHLRLSYAYQFNSSYPSSRPDSPIAGPPQPPPMSMASAATSDMGEYRIRLKRFSPSAPDVAYYAGVENFNFNSVVLSVSISTNHPAGATAAFQYGLTSSYGSEVAAINSPVNGVTTQYVRATVTGLLPNTTYHFRAKATNSLGTSYGALDNTFTTPPAPEGWVFQQSNVSASLYDIALRSDSAAVAVGEGSIARSTNAGQTWTQVNNPGAYLLTVSAAGPDSLVGGGYGYLRSSDGGSSWNYSIVGLGGGVSRIRFGSSQIGIAVTYNGDINRTTNGGESWTNLRTGSNQFHDAQALNKDTVYVSGSSGTLLRSYNFSAPSPAWDSVATGTTGYLLGVAFLDPDTGMVVGSFGVRRTTDGGLTWTTLPGFVGYWYRDIAFKNATHGVIVGDQGTILRTTNSGATWTVQQSGTYNSLYAAGFKGRTVMAVGQNGLILKYTEPLDEGEPNNTSAEAQILAYDDQVSGTIQPSTDVDYYKFTAPANDTVEVLLQNSTFNGQVELIGTNGTSVLSQNDDYVAGDTSRSRVVFALSGSGTYYMRVTPVAAGRVGSYVLGVRKTNLKPAIVFRGYSNLGPTGVTLLATVDPNNLSTSVSFKWGTTGNFNNTAAGVPSPISGQQRQNVTATLSLSPFTNYNFKVVTTNAAGSDTSLPQSFLTPRNTAIAESEPNDDSSSAMAIVYGDSVNGSIAGSMDSDYYEFDSASGDTVEIFGKPRGTSTLTSYIRLFEASTGNEYAGNNYFPSSSNPHVISEIPNGGRWLIRYSYSNNFVNFPNEAPEGEPLIVPSSASQVAAADTAGDYQMFLRKFAPSAPDIYSFGSVFSRFANSATVGGTIGPNGLSTNVSIEYGLTTGYGASAPAVQGALAGIYSTTVYANVSGLVPGSVYNYRIVAANSQGTTNGPNFTFSTPVAAEGWSVQPSGIVDGLNNTHFVTETTGFAVGNGGRILKTTNGGATWQTQTSSWGGTINGVWFVDANLGFTVGSSGSLQKTTDGGATWTNQHHSSFPFLRKVQFVNATTGYAVGNSYILKTTDAGTNWSDSRVTSIAYLGLSFVDANNGYVVGTSGTVLKTSNGGATWDSLTTIGVTSTIQSVRFFSATTGMITYGNTIRRTTDAGATWTTSSTGLGGTLTGMSFTDATNGIAVGSGGTVLRTYDGGLTWSRQQSGTSNTLNSVAFVGRYAYAVGGFGTILNSVGILALPTSFNATYDSLNLVTVSWTDNAVNETGYFVQRKTGTGGTYSNIRTTGAFPSGPVSIVDTVLRGNIYYYRTRVFTAGIDTSSYSAEDSALVPLAVPSNFDASSVSSTRIDLSWQNISDARAGYRIERKTGAGGTYAEITTVGSAVTTYQNTNLSPGTRYYYRIRSYNAGMNSAYTNEDSAATALGKPSGIAINPSGWSGSDYFEVSWTSPTGAAKAWYRIDAAPTAILTGTETDLLTPTSFGFTLPAAGQHWAYFYLADSSGNKDYATYDSLLARWDNVSPQISHNNALVSIVTFNAGNITSNPVSIDATVSKTGGFTPLQGAELEFKKTNDNTINYLNYPSATGGSVTIPNVTFLTNAKPNGVDYRIVAVDSAGNYVETAWYSIPVQVQSNTPSDFVPPAAGQSEDANTLVKGYRLFSVPIDLTDKKPQSFMESTDRGLGPHAKEGVNYVNWRLQRFLSGGATRQDYEDFKNQDVLVPGAAFFLLAREPRIVTVGGGSLVKAQDMFNTGISVQNGWNLVGNPFPDDFPADSVFVVAGSIATRAYYDGNGPDAGWHKTGTQVQNLRKWEGLAINVTANTFLRFKALPPVSSQNDVPPPPFVSAKAAIEQEKGAGWLVKFNAYRRDNDSKDIENTIGAAPNAREGYDSYDSFQPPILSGKNVALYFKNPDGAMSDDIRPVKADGQMWEMRVMTGDRGARLMLNVEQAAAFPDAATQAYLLDLDDHMAHNLRQQKEIEFNSKEGMRSFKVAVGTKQFVDSVSASVGIDLVPRSMTLYQNYPNPFNPETAIRFTVPGLQPSYRVTLKVYNIIGQEVATLVDREMPGGYYETVFNGRGFASGTYIFRLVVTAGTRETSFSDVKKMVLIK